MLLKDVLTNLSSKTCDLKNEFDFHRFKSSLAFKIVVFRGSNFDILIFIKKK